MKKLAIFALLTACAVSYSAEARVCFVGTSICSDGTFSSTPTEPTVCHPLADEDESTCAYGMEDCSDGCGGTRKCCAPKPDSKNNPIVCTPKADETSCTYGTTTCSDGCGGIRLCCAVCEPMEDDDPAVCAYGTTTCSDACGGTRTCCADAPAEEPATKEKYYYACFNNDGSVGTGVGEWLTENTCYNVEVTDQDGNPVEAELDYSVIWCSGCWQQEQGHSTSAPSYNETTVSGCFTETYDNGIDEKLYKYISHTYTINGKKYTFDGEPSCHKIAL